MLSFHLLPADHQDEIKRLRVARDKAARFGTLNQFNRAATTYEQYLQSVLRTLDGVK